MPSKKSKTSIDHPTYYHPKQLDLNQVQELPDSHAWTSSDTGLLQSNYDDSCQVPMIDLEDKNVQELIGHACKTWGIFQVKNHGISETLLNKIEDAGKTLFSLPMHQKLKASRTPDGVTGYGVARISSFFPKLMWSEGFTIIGSPLEHARQLWPQDYTIFW